MSDHVVRYAGHHPTIPLGPRSFKRIPALYELRGKVDFGVGAAGMQGGQVRTGN